MVGVEWNHLGKTKLKTMILKFKAYHLAFVLNYFQDIILRDYYHLVKQIDDKMHQHFDQGQDYMIEVDVIVAEVLAVFEMLTRSPEGVVAAINREIDADLVPQIAEMLPIEAAEQEQGMNTLRPYTALYRSLMAMKANNYRNKIAKIESGYAAVGLDYAPPEAPDELKPFL